MAEELTIGQVIARRFALVEEIEKIEAGHKTELQPLKDELYLCEKFTHEEMLRSGQQNTKTDAGMAFFSDKSKAVVEDYDRLLAEIREKGLWQLLTRAVSKDAVKEYIAEHGQPPVGVKWESYRGLSWRRG